MTKTYTPFWVHSTYSLLESSIRIEELCKRAVELGLQAVAITDQHNLFGAMEFSLTCQKYKLKPIIGCQVKIEHNSQILLYCQSQVGYENLSYLLTKSYTNPENKIEFQWEDLAKHSEGLFAIVVPSLLHLAEFADLKKYADKLQSSISWYVGLEPDKCQNESAYLSSLFDTPVVATSPTYFLVPEDEEAHDTLLCIKHKNYISQTNRIKSNPNLYLMNSEQMYSLYPESEFAVENTNQLAEKCNFALVATGPKLPSFQNPESNFVDENEMLKNQAEVGLKSMQISPAEYPAYKARLDYELEVIVQMGFAGYFLIVGDFVQFARDQLIAVSIRGSGAGSLVARCINITDIDPIRFELFFERFLNPGRVSMPDFDVDFSPTGRETTIKYVQNKYGKESVSGIITFGSLASRAALKDVGRVLQVSYNLIDNLSKRIQVLFGRPFTLQETYDMDPEFAKEVNESEILTKTFTIAKKLEGLYRHTSAHAAGIIITDSPIYRTAPLYKDESSDLPLVQFSMKYAELAGLIKFDFLGVTALDIIADTLNLLREEGIVVDLYNTSLDDEKTFALLRSGHTQGVFQFETHGMTKLIQDMEADCIEDLIATVALYRPGPMDNIPLFIRCKKGTEKIQYLYPDLEPILANTYGIIVYQEQILRIVQDIAGYTLSEADILRRVIGKKIPKEMAESREMFIKRAYAKQGGDKDKPEALFKLIETFANYGFNKAHAVAYAIVGYRGAYLKSSYPLHFLCVSMTFEQLKHDKLVQLIFEAHSMGIKLRGPCINRSMDKFTISNDEIEYSLLAIKNIGKHVFDQIAELRPFTSVSDFLDQVKLNKREVESLVKAGALDCLNTAELGYNRGLLLEYTMILFTKQASLFDPISLVNPNNTWSELEEIIYEKEMLSLYLNRHPVDLYYPHNLNSTYLSTLDLSKDYGYLETICFIDTITPRISKTNKPYLLLDLSDPRGSAKAMILAQEIVPQVQKLKNQIAWCRVQIKNNNIIIKEALDIHKKIKTLQNINIRINSEEDLYKFKEVYVKHRTNQGVAVTLETDEHMSVGYIDDFMNFAKELAGFQWSAT